MGLFYVGRGCKLTLVLEVMQHPASCKFLVRFDFDKYKLINNIIELDLRHISVLAVKSSCLT